MSSRYNLSFSEFSASQPISSPAVCSVCALTSHATCPACDDALCLAHLYVCPDCDTPLCASCLAEHREEGHWSDSETAAERHASQAPRQFRPANVSELHASQALCQFRPANVSELQPLHHSPLPTSTVLHRARAAKDSLHSEAPSAAASHCPLPHDNCLDAEAYAAQPALLPTCSHRFKAPEPHDAVSFPALPACSTDSNSAALLQRLRAHVQRQTESRRLAPPPLHACFYIQIFCVRCGYMRQALPAPPHGETIACPGCTRQRPFVALAIGFTRHTLPFHERFFLAGHAPHQLPWDKLRSPDRPPRRKKPARSLDAETREFLQLQLERFRLIADSMLRST